MNDCITLAHGNGGKLSWELIDRLFLRYFSTTLPKQGNDAAELTLSGNRIAMTTDSFVVHPITFPGGNIGKLAVCGTVNDLLTAGAHPRYLSCGLIIEEGLPLAELESVIASMAETARACGVEIVTGDTKVVQKGAADKLFINTTGVGVLRQGVDLSAHLIRPGDQVIVTGTLGEHGCSILLAREELNIGTDIISDCAPLTGLVDALLATGVEIHAMRDPTRGGLATTLNELAGQSRTAMILHEDKIPVNDSVRGLCEILGLDPLYLANEGKMIIVAPQHACDTIMRTLVGHPLGQNAQVIGEVVAEPARRVLLQTSISKRILDMPI
ncbi:MAG TPA: hydrogenase expression/formation protein HypE, partial [Armatimonadota bacterium]|nr:hydrogenase expression/formation protein HypE [Armatimonadota bacterium]